MRFFVLTSLLAWLVVTAHAVAPQKSVLISYQDHTPDSVLREAMDAIRESGGVITHQFSLIKGFAAKASAKALETVSTLGSQYFVNVEEDSIVSIDGDTIENGHTN